MVEKTKKIMTMELAEILCIENGEQRHKELVALLEEVCGYNPYIVMKKYSEKKYLTGNTNVKVRLRAEGAISSPDNITGLRGPRIILRTMVNLSRENLANGEWFLNLRFQVKDKVKTFTKDRDITLSSLLSQKKELTLFMKTGEVPF